MRTFLKVVAIAIIFLCIPPLIAARADVEVIRETPVLQKTFETEMARLASKYGQNEQLARAIIHCESKGQESAYNVNVDASSTPWSKDIGWWQINDYYHKSEALKRGFDITDKWQNLEYGFVLMKEQGTKPWDASKYCWG